MEWDVVITVQTALHVGDGERWYRDVDFVVEQPGGGAPRATLIDVDRALELVDEVELQRIANGQVARGLGERRRRECTVATLRIRPMRRGSNVSEWVLRFIRDGTGRLYLPGSTVKGALRTAILRTLLRRSGARPDALIAETRAEILEQRLRRLRFEGRKADPANLDALRALRVSDFYPEGETATELSEVEVRDIQKGRGVLSVWVETVPRNGSFRGRIAIDETLLERGEPDGAVAGLLRALPDVVRQDTLEVLRVLDGWEASPNRTRPYGTWLTAINANTPPLAFLGWGTGWAPHTVGALLTNPRDRLEFARKHNLGRGGPIGADFPKSGKFVLTQFETRSRPMPLGLVAVDFAPTRRKGRA